MPKEKEHYRKNLERIIERFPNKEILTAKEVAQFLNKDPHTIKKHFPFKKWGISIVTLASELS